MIEAVQNVAKIGLGFLVLVGLTACTPQTPRVDTVRDGASASGTEVDAGQSTPAESETSSNTAKATAESGSGLRTAWVSAKEGLRVRDTASTSGKVLTLLPYRAEVLVHQEKPEVVEIGGVSGKWTEVEWESYRGWAFGGYLTLEAAAVLAPESVSNLAAGSLSWPVTVNGVVYQCAIDFSEPGWDIKKNQDDTRGVTYRITKGNAVISIPVEGKGGPDDSQTTVRTFVPLSPIPFELERTEVKIGRPTWSVRYSSKKSEFSLSIEATDSAGLSSADIAVFDRALRSLRLIMD